MRFVRGRELPESCVVCKKEEVRRCFWRFREFLGCEVAGRSVVGLSWQLSFGDGEVHDVWQSTRPLDAASPEQAIRTDSMSKSAWHL